MRQVDAIGTGCGPGNAQRRRTIVVLQQGPALGLQIIELAVSKRPGEHQQDPEDQEYRQRNQQIETFQYWPSVFPGSPYPRSNRNALRMTNKDDPAMPRPAMAGGIAPASASGMQTAL